MSDLKSVFTAAGKPLLAASAAILALCGTFFPAAPCASAENHGAVNVLDHGARGDGVHDDSAAIQRAADIAASKAKTLFIPEGEYLFKSDIRLRCSVLSRGVLLKKIEIDGDRTSGTGFMAVRFPVKNPLIIFEPDHEEVELDASAFFGIREGDLRVPVYRDVSTAGGDKVSLAEGGTVRFNSTDFHTSRVGSRGQTKGRRDISLVISTRGDVFPEFAFSYDAPPEDPQEWSRGGVFAKGDYVQHNGRIYCATWASGEGVVYGDHFRGRVEVGPVEPSGTTTRVQADRADGGTETIAVWRLLRTHVYYREKDEPIRVDGLRVELRLKENTGEYMRTRGGAVDVLRSNVVFNDLKISVRDRELMMQRLLRIADCVNVEVNNSLISGATYPGLGYNITHSNNANTRFNNCISNNSRKGMDGNYSKNTFIIGGLYNNIDSHYGRNMLIRDAVVTGLQAFATHTSEQPLGFKYARAPIGFAGPNLRVENVVLDRVPTGIFRNRDDAGNLSGRIVFKDIFVQNNEGDVPLFEHRIVPRADYGRKVDVPSELIIENVALENPGALYLRIGMGFEGGAYGPVYIRNTGPIGGVLSASPSTTFVDCEFESTRFSILPGAFVNFRNCVFSGNNTGLDEARIGFAAGNVVKKGAVARFPVEYVNEEIYETRDGG